MMMRMMVVNNYDTEHDNDKSETVVAWISESWKESKNMFMSNHAHVCR